MTQRDMAGHLSIDVKTLRNWRKNKPNLYNIIMLGFAVEKILHKTDENHQELQKLYDKILLDSSSKKKS